MQIQSQNRLSHGQICIIKIRPFHKHFSADRQFLPFLRLPPPQAEDPEAAAVRELLQRDRKLRGIPDEVPTDLQGPEPALIQSQPAAPSAPAGAQAVAARTQSIEASQGEAPITDSDGPKTSSAAILRGVEELGRQNPADAIEYFQKALELPGKGAFRMKDSPREYSCASEGEEMAALYNLACAYTAMHRTDAALASLEGAFEAGFQDYNTCREDPDLKLLQGPQLEALIQKSQTSQQSGGLWGAVQKFWKRGG